jgi:DnaJ-domain-containing protein 1
MMNTSVSNAHTVLGVALDATPEEVRRAYLALVRQYPPDRDAEKFREIHTAYQLLSDPLVQAEAFLTPSHDRPDLSQIIAAAEKERPRLTKLALLALGNQE